MHRFTRLPCARGVLSPGAHAFAACLFFCFGAGCGGRPLFGPVGALARSYVYENEDVQIRMLTGPELAVAPPGVQPSEWGEHLAQELPGLFTRQPSGVASARAAAALPLAPIVGLLAGAAVDQVRAQIEKEAELYEAQFSSLLYESGFWELNTDANGITTGKPRYYGFEVTRYAKGFRTDDTPAFRFVCAIAPANAIRKSPGAPDTDERIFALKPLLFQTNAARAKVLFVNSRINSKVDLAIDATWIDRNQSVHQERVAATDFEFKGYDLAKTTPVPGSAAGKWKKPKMQVEPLLVEGRVAGWFGGLPVSLAPDGKVKANGAFKVTALVTESDQSQAKQTFERVGKYLKDNRDKIVAGARDPFEDGNGNGNGNGDGT